MQTQLIQIKIKDNQVVSLPCIKDGSKLIKVFDYEKNELKYDSVRDAVFYKNDWRPIFTFVSPKITTDDYWDNLPRID